MRGINPSTPPRGASQADGSGPAGNRHRFIFQAFLNHCRLGASPMQAGALFHPRMADETNLRPDETKFPIREDSLKRMLGISLVNNTTGRQGP
jgi:hypothetical protein